MILIKYWKLLEKSCLIYVGNEGVFVNKSGLIVLFFIDKCM